MKSIVLAGDHAGYEYKKLIKKHLETKGFTVLDKGTNSGDSVDYPDYVHPLAKALQTDEINQGIVICGSGNGVAITANKHQHVRAALAWNEELAALARQHNDANVLAIPARFVSVDLAIRMVDTFITTDFEGGRHARRVGKIACG